MLRLNRFWKNVVAVNSILLMLFGFTQRCYAQGEETNLGFDIRPHSPEIASLGKYATTPVGYFTGIPSINIPIYTIVGTKLSAPIGLSYHAAGIKVEETASMVGLGWSLQAGGAVTRQVRGIPDDTNYIGFLNSTYKPSDFESEIGTLASVTRMREVMNRTLDLETDIYSFSAPGLSGEFYFDENGMYHLKSQQDVRITFIKNSDGLILEWIVTAPNGSKYYFGKSKDGNRNARDEQDIRTLSQNRTEILPSGVITWHLLDIVDVNATDQISYFYKVFLSRTCTYGSETKSWLATSGMNCQEPHSSPLNYSESLGHLMLLDSISSANSLVKFHKINDRLDFSGSKSLDKISIYNRKGTLLKVFDFVYSYFVSSDQTVSTPCSMMTADQQRKRLKLETLQEFDAIGNSIPPHRFFYNSVKLPGKFSKSVDYWGYYNGRSNTTLIPKMEVEGVGSGVTYLEGADRSSDISFSKAATLTKIIYPTSGSVEYEYEQNKINKTGEQKLPGILNFKTFALVDENAVRVSDTLVIAHHDSDHVWIEYQYMNPPDCEPSTRGCELKFTIKGIGNSFNMTYYAHSGRLMLNNGVYLLTVEKQLEEFNYDRFLIYWEEAEEGNAGLAWAGGLRVSKIITKDDRGGKPIVMKYEYSGGSLTSTPIMGWREHQPECGTCLEFIRSSVSSYPLATTMGGYVGYRNVKEIYGENGENGYVKMEFDFNYDNDIAAMEFPFPPPDVFTATRGDLLIKEYYSASNERIKREDYLYSSAFGQNNIHYSNVEGFKVSGTINGACFAKYPTSGFWKYIQSKVEKTFASTGVISDSLVYEYDHPDLYVMPNRERSYTSDGVVREVIRKYPLDTPSAFSFSFNTTELAAKNEMVDRFMISQPLEEVYFKSNTPAQKIRRDFKIDENHLVPSRNHRAADGINYVDEIHFDEYDFLGNVRQISKRTSPVESYVWSTDGTELHAIATNANRNQVFYTSFEENGVVGEAKTGDKYYEGSNYTIALVDRPTGNNLRMTYWYYDGTWKFQPEQDYTTTLSAPGATRYDEVRVFPKGAQLTTYTYRAGVGVSCITDVNNLASYFDYDSYGRLLLTKDDQGNVLKRYTYNYKQ